MAARVRPSAANQPRDLTELRLLVELPALRRLADRGLSDQELAVIRELADATMRSARNGDVPGYLYADMVFHLYLLELTGEAARSEIARLLLAPGPGHAPPAEESGHLMATAAREHRELVGMLTDDMVSAADDLLRKHVSRPWPAAAVRPYPPGRNPSDVRTHEMADRISSGDPTSRTAEADLHAFFRHRDDVPTAWCTALTNSLSGLRGSDDPAVTFAGLPRACVPAFADGCQVELSDGAERPFRVTHPASPADGAEPAVANPVGSDHVLLTPFQVVSRTGYPPYAGIVTHWWTDREPSESDAAIADLMVKHLIALVDHERLMVAVARAEDRAASLALEAISGRIINVAIGVVMHQRGLAPDDAENLLRQSARMAGTGLAQVAAGVLRSGMLADSVRPHGRSDPVARDLVLVNADLGDPAATVAHARRSAGDCRLRRRSPP